MKTHRLLLLHLMCTYSLLLFAQKQPEHEKKIYLAPDGKVFVQKSLPVYLLIGTTPDHKDSAIVLKSTSTPQYSNPMYFDTEGRNTFRHPWAVDKNTMNVKLPKQEVIFEAYADSRSPITDINFGNAKPMKHNGKLYINGNAEISLTAKDELSGVEKIMLSVDSSDYKEYTSPFVLDKEKEYVLKFYSYDHVGNTEPLKTVTLVIDRSKPKSTLEIKGDYYENVVSGNSQIILKTEDNSSGIAKISYKLDNDPERNYTGAFKTSMLVQGEHQLVYYAVDNVGNQEEQHLYNFYIDKTPPTILQEIIGKSFMANGKEFSSGRSQLKLTTLDNKAGVKEVYYSINNGEFKLYEKPVFLSSVNGKISVKAYATDKVNNRSQVTEDTNSEQVSYIDLSGPKLSYNFTGPVFFSSDTVYISSKTKIHLRANDNESGVNNIQYKIDAGNDLKIYSAPISIDQEGFHIIEYVGTDNVENTNTSSFKVMVDNTGPAIYPRFSTAPKGILPEQGKDIILYPNYVGLFVAATDIESGYDHMTYTLNGSKEKLFTGYISGLPKKSQITIKAYDKLGNATVTNLEFAIRN